MAKKPDFTNYATRQANRLATQSEVAHFASDDRVRAVMHPYERVPSDLEQLEVQIGELVQFGLASTWHIGYRLKEIKNRKLYALKGYDDFKSYVRGEMSFEAAWAYQNIQLVEVFSRDLVEQHGTRLTPALSYIRLGGDEARRKVHAFVNAQGEMLRQSDLRRQITLWRKELKPKGRPFKKRVRAFSRLTGNDIVELRVSDPSQMDSLLSSLRKSLDLVEE